MRIVNWFDLPLFADPEGQPAYGEQPGFDDVDTTFESGTMFLFAYRMSGTVVVGNHRDYATMMCVHRNVDPALDGLQAVDRSCGHESVGTRFSDHVNIVSLELLSHPP